MLLSAGAGLTVLVAVAEIRGNLADEFTGALPASAPSFYFIDIQPADLPTFEAALRKTGAAHDLQIMPSLRARILAVAGVPVEQFHAPSQTAWPLRTTSPSPTLPRRRRTTNLPKANGGRRTISALLWSPSMPASHAAGASRSATA